MDKRVFARAKSSKDIQNVFLNDVRKNIDKKMVRDVKFESEGAKMEPPKRLPATNNAKEMDKKMMDYKKGPQETRPTPMKVKPPVAPVDKIKKSERQIKSKFDSSNLRKPMIQDMMRKRAIEYEQNRLPAGSKPPPPTKLPAGETFDSQGSFQ